MFDALLSLAPGLSEKQKRKRSDEIIGYGIETVGTQGRLPATGGWRGASAVISPRFFRGNRGEIATGPI
jgi:hypothetical protein